MPFLMCAIDLNFLRGVGKKSAGNQKMVLTKISNSVKPRLRQNDRYSDVQSRTDSPMVCKKIKNTKTSLKKGLYCIF
jgi:hypothetical protein